MSGEVRLGIDVACTAAHQASLADERGVFLWQGWRFRTTTQDLERLWAKIPDGVRVVVVMEPTRNAWTPLAAWFEARGRSCRSCPLSSPRICGTTTTSTPRPTGSTRRCWPVCRCCTPTGSDESRASARPIRSSATRRRSSLQKRRVACAMRLDALLELLGPGWLEVFGRVSYGKTAVAVLERYASPVALKKLGRARLTKLVIRASRGAWREAKADELLEAADETLTLWAAGGLDFEELAEDIAIEVRQIKALDAEIAVLDNRIEALYETADPAGIVASTPGIGTVLAAGILSRTGDLNRFENLAGIGSFTGLVPKIDQSGVSDHHSGPAKAGDPGLRQALFLAADLARKADPTPRRLLPPLYVDAGKHHNSAICTIAAVLITRIAACWRNGELYELRHTDGRLITEAEGRKICAERYKIDTATRASRRNGVQPRTGRRGRESTEAAPAADPPNTEPTEKAA